MKVYTLRDADLKTIVTGRRAVYTRPADAAANRRHVAKGTPLELVEYDLGVQGERVIDQLFGSQRDY